MTIRCVVVDDEFLAIKILEAYLDRITGVELVATFQDPLAARDYLLRNQVDLLFVDVQMQPLSGLDLVRNLPQPILLVFTTARQEFAVAAFELQALDYLVKPVSFERFEQSVQRARDRLTAQQPPERRFIEFKMEYKLLRVFYDEIIYIEGLSEYVRIHTKTKKHITLAALRDLETTLPSDKFIRIHKSFIVAKAGITSYNGTTVQLADGLKLPIGRVYKPGVMEDMKRT